MAVNSVVNTFHLLFRLIGLTGLLALVVAVVIWNVVPGDGWQVYGYDLPGAPLAWQIGLAAAAAVLLALLFEIRGVAGLFTSRKAALGSNVLVQVILATVLLAGVNYFALNNYKRFDLTRDAGFTLSEEIRADLAKLRDKTDIVVFQQYVSFGQRGDVRQDKYDIAAQKKIVEKVKDLAELFQDLGPRFRVRVLDIQDDDHEKKLRQIRDEAPQLAEAIEQAPENSIFFWTAEQQKLQRLSFNDIYQLDKTASIAEGNLVLNYQKERGFANKVFNIEEKKPRIGVAVVHELLSVKTADPFYGMPGLKKSLEARGFDYRDVILKTKWGQGARPEPAVLTHDENKFERLEAQAANFERLIKIWESDLGDIVREEKIWKGTPLPELNKKYAIVRTLTGARPIEMEQLEAIRKERGGVPPTRKITEEDREVWLEFLAEAAKEHEDGLEQFHKKLGKATTEKTNLNVENLEEQRRIADLKAKFTRMLADVDLLVVPRHTIYDVVREEAIPASVHVLDDAQIDAIKDFMKAGKPVMFCLGPSNERAESFDSPKDTLAEVLTSLGLQLPNQTILYNAEADALADKSERVLMGGSADVPPVKFEWQGAAVKNIGKTAAGEPHPVRRSLALTARAFGSEPTEEAFGANDPTELQIRAPRPVYYLSTSWNPKAVATALGAAAGPWGTLPATTVITAAGEKKVDESAFIMLSSEESWNDEQPFATEKRIPQYERPKPDDPKRGTIEERRRGPFPIGVAVETQVPASWYGEKPPDKLPTVRLAVLGHGGVFMGENLKPMNEKLFLDTANWLMGRDDLLARDSQTWSYPRVSLSDEQNALWQWGTRLGLPLVFVYLGMVMLLVRRMR
jgi:hypothetical protein